MNFLREDITILLAKSIEDFIFSLGIEETNAIKMLVNYILHFNLYFFQVLC